MIMKLLKFSGLLAILMFSASCNFSKSINKDLNTGLLTKGNGLSCAKVYLSSGEKEVKRSEFIYGEKIFVVFEGIAGFERKEGAAFPGMKLQVTDPLGNKLMDLADLYAEYTEGVEHDPLELNTWISMADPIHSGQEYKLFIEIWDKEGEGTFSAEMDFTVVPDEEIKTESQQVTYDEVYLFSEARNEVLMEHRAGFNETLYMIIEGLEGFTVIEDMVNAGLSLTLSDAAGNQILNEGDLQAGSPIKASDFQERLVPNFVLTGTEVSNPVTCRLVVWDKHSEARLTITTLLQVE